MKKRAAIMLNNARDEIKQRKIQFSVEMQQPQVQAATMVDINTHQYPTVLLIGTSNVKEIKEDKL
jgi:hypothetical protein